jgi:hypothetical protein
VLLLLFHWDVVPHEYIVSDVYRMPHEYECSGVSEQL